MEERMKRACVGIDSCDGLQNTMVVAGSKEDIDTIHKIMMDILGNNGIKVPHFKNISRSKRETISKQIIGLFRNANKVSFVLFEHKKPMGVSKKSYYFDYIPEKLIEHLCGFDTRNRFMMIEVHDDYNVYGMQTKDFVEAVLRRLSRRLSGDDKGIKIISEGEYENSKLKSKSGNYIKIRGVVVRGLVSKSINIADMSMGFYKNYPKLFSGKIRFREI